MNTRSAEDYLNLPYHFEIIHDTSGEAPGWFARVVELPGCMTQTDTFEELLPMLHDAMRAWITASLEDGQSIPEPQGEENYSGKFVTRVPRALHRQLAWAAQNEGVSLNAFICSSLAQKVGQLTTTTPQPPAPEVTSAWPHLSPQARQALRAVGLYEEVENIDERLFAAWLQDHLQQAQAALAKGHEDNAIDHLTSSIQALNQCNANPLLAVFAQSLRLLAEQIGQFSQLKQGLVQQTLVAGRMNAQGPAKQPGGPQKYVVHEKATTPYQTDKE